jgi:spore germination cell wall hydrolase CwlJ-like protein
MGGNIMFKYAIFGLLAWLGYGFIAQNQAVQDMERTIAIIKNSNIKETTELVLFKDLHPIKYTGRDLDCLARNIFFEAGTEDTMGKYAVAQVTLNRVASGYWGHNVCAVVYSPNQFSWTSDRELATTKLDSENWHESRAVAQAVLGQGYRVKTLKKALFYHADYTNPPWTDHDKVVGKVGRHIFYTKAKGSWLSL